MVVLPELSKPMMMILSYFLPISFEKSLPKKPPIQSYYSYTYTHNKVIVSDCLKLVLNRIVGIVRGDWRGTEGFDEIGDVFCSFGKGIVLAGLEFEQTALYLFRVEHLKDLRVVVTDLPTVVCDIADEGESRLHALRAFLVLQHFDQHQISALFKQILIEDLYILRSTFDVVQKFNIEYFARLSYLLLAFCLGRDSRVDYCDLIEHAFIEEELNCFIDVDKPA